MSKLRRRLGRLAMRTLTSDGLRSALRRTAELRRRARGESHRVRYFHQAGDPYGHLAVQTLAELGARYAIELEVRLVGPPPDDAAPERALLDAYSLVDATDVAAGYGLAAPATPNIPARETIGLAERCFAAAVGRGDFARRAPAISTALWSGDASALDALDAGPASEAETGALVAAGNAERDTLGHYLGAMFHYGGEWYWGVDRLWHLERRLQSLGLLRSGADATPIAPRPDPSQLPAPTADPDGARVRLEYFPSLRSPYTAIAMDRTFALAQRLPVELVVRPVMPMVMRGLPVPRRKGLYILRDTKREANDAGEAFGDMCDPVGEPVRRGFSLFPWASEQGKGAEYLRSFTDGVFREGIDAFEDEGLAVIVERVGLSWQEAKQRLGRPGWEDELEANRLAMFASGLWGVPSYRIPATDAYDEYATWGQDRIWRVEQEIRRRIGAAGR